MKSNISTTSAAFLFSDTLKQGFRILVTCTTLQLAVFYGGRQSTGNIKRTHTHIIHTRLTRILFKVSEPPTQMTCTGPGHTCFCRVQYGSSPFQNSLIGSNFNKKLTLCPHESPHEFFTSQNLSCLPLCSWPYPTARTAWLTSRHKKFIFQRTFSSFFSTLIKRIAQRVEPEPIQKIL